MEHCERFTDLISQSLDGSLSPEDQQALQQHLEQCPECRLLSQQLLEVQRELRVLEDQEVPEGFTEGVMARIRALEKKPEVIPIWKHPQFKIFGSIAACALICVGIWRMGTPNITQDMAFSTEAAAPAAESSAQIKYTVSAPSAAQPAAGAKLSQEPAAANATLSDANELSLHVSTDTPQSFDLSHPEAASQAPQSSDLVHLVQDTLDITPGILLVVEEFPEELEGTRHTAENGSVLLVLHTQPEADLWKTCQQTAQFYVELGEGPIVFICNN